MRRLARLLPFIAILLLLAIAALVLLRSGPLADHVRAVIASELSKTLDRDVSIGSAGLTASGRVALHDILVRNDDGTALLKAPHVSVQVAAEGGLLSLLSGSTGIRSVRLVDPELTLARRPDGKLSVSDLLERPREAPSRFRGSVEIEGGKITFIDEANDGLTTSLTGVRTSFEYPRPDKAIFAVEVGENTGVFDSLELRGEINTETGTTSVDCTADGVVIPYVLARVPEMGFGEIPSGTADLTGKVSFTSGEDPAFSYDVRMQLSGVEVAFPWLRRPLQRVKGQMRVAEGAVALRQVAGTVAGAPVTVNGSIGHFSAPVLDLHITSPGIRYAQVQELLPELSLPTWVVLPKPLQVTADVQGPAADVTVTGSASMAMIEVRAVPWHDLVMPFEYRRGRLKFSPSAHGSPRRFEAEVELDLLKPRPAGAGTASLANVPLSLLAAMAGVQGDFEGTVQATLRGEVSADSTFSGTVHATEVSVRGIALGELEGDFTYAEEVLLLPELRLSGPLATGSLEATLSLAGDYEVKARLTRLDLSSVGAPLHLAGLRGQCCAQLEVSGHVRNGTVGGQVVLGPGEIQGRDFESLSGDFSVSPTRAAVEALELRLGRGQCTGEIAVDDWKGPRERAEVSGRLDLSGFGLDEWLPPQVSMVSPSARVSGSVALDGTLADPGVGVDLRFESLSVAGQPLDAGDIRARYGHGRLTVEKGHVGIAGGHLSVSGGYGPDTGFSLELDGRDIQLDRLTASWRSRLGLALTGTLAARARLTGPLERPELSLSLAAGTLTLNQEQFDEFELHARFKDSMFGIGSFALRQGESSVSLSGTFDAEDESIAAELNLEELDIGVLAMIANSAVYRLDRTRKDRPRSSFLQGYSRAVSLLTRRPEGALTAAVVVSGAIAAPQIEVVSFTLDEAAFDGVRIDHIEGGLTAWLRRQRPGGLVLERAALKLGVKHGLAEASLVGDLSPEQRGKLELGVDNLDLQLLDPSLPLARLEHGRLTLTALPLTQVPARAPGRGLLRIGGLGAISQGDLHLKGVSFAPVTGMDPIEFDADIYLRENKVLLEEVTDEGDIRPGVRGAMGSGTFSLGGYAQIGGGDVGQREGSQFDVTLSLNDAELALPGIPGMKINGSVSLASDPISGGALLTTRRDNGIGHDPLVVSDAVLGVPKVALGEVRGEPFFSPALDVMILVGEDVRFRYGSERRPSEVQVEPGHLPEEGEPTGYLHVTGTATADGVELVGEFESREGVLAFPNGTLQLQQARAWVSREAGEPPAVTINATAAGRVGDYYVSLRPSGQIVPYDADLIQLNATSIPPLEEGFVLALLGGTVVAQGAESQSGLAGLLGDPTRAPGREGQIEGVMVPAFTSVSGPAVGFDVGTSGQVRLRLAQELSERFVISYVSSLTGARESYTLRFIYQITHLWSIGRAVDELEQGRWEVQAFIPF